MKIPPESAIIGILESPITWICFVLGLVLIGGGVFAVQRVRRATDAAEEEQVDEVFEEIEKKQYVHDISELEEIHSERRL